MAEIRHVMPIGDFVEHTPREDCVCGPAIEELINWGSERPVGLIVTHHSLDGREKHE